MDSTSQQLTDQQLLSRYVHAADEQAFAELTDRHLNALYGAARRQVRNPHLAEDVVQAVLMVLARRASSLRREGSLAGWLMKVTWYTARAAIRTERRRLRREQEAHAAMRNYDGNSPVDVALAWEEISPLLDDALARLSAAERGVIMLRFLEDRKLAEVAQLLGISEDAAAKRVTRALANLRRLFTRRGLGVSAATLSITLTTAAAELAPLSLCASAARSALAAKASLSSASTASSLLAKGPLMAMTTAKITTAITIAVICLLGITASVIVFHVATDQRASWPAPASAAAPIGSEPPEFMKVYGLDDGQVLKRVVNAPASIRDAYVGKYYAFAVGSFFIGWQNNTRAASENFPASYRLVDILTLPATARPLSEVAVEGDPQLLQKQVSGDIAFLYNATDEQYSAGLMELLHNEFSIDVHLTFQNVPRTVIVFHGQWNFQSVSDLPNADDLQGMQTPAVELYVHGPLDPDHCRSNGSNNRWGFERVFSTLLGQQVLFDKSVTRMPAFINDRVYCSPAEVAQNRDTFLQNFTLQTGLTWTEESRLVRRLVVEKVQH